MLKDKEKLYQTYHALLNAALTWALVLTVNQYFSLRVSIVLSAVISFVAAVLIYLFDLNRKSIICYIFLGSIIPLIVFAFWLVKFNPFSWSRRFIEWCWLYDGSKELYAAQYANFLAAAVALLVAILFYFLIKNQLAKIILAAIITIVLIIFCINKININKAVVGISTFYMLSIIVEIYGKVNSKRTEKPDKKEAILYLAPICLLISVLSIWLPSKQEPMQWPSVKNVYYSVKDQIEIWLIDLDYYFGNMESEFRVSGYSDESGDLGSSGKLVNDKKVALKVSGMEEDSSVYLIGSISNVYTGNSWDKSSSVYLIGEKEYLLDYSEMFYALARQDLDVLESNEFLQKRLIEINYNKIKTKTFFYPLKISRYNFLSKYKKLSAEAAQITFGKARGKGTSYQSTFFEMNLEGTAFVQMLRDADTFSYENENNINPDSISWLNDNVIDLKNSYYPLTDKEVYEALRQRAKLIQSNYTALPEELPNRVKELALEITADYDTTYDKLKAIETFLHSYTYTLEPGQLPEGEDFTDYFLFESKKGYCTSFATSMAVLGRCIGIPTRYVEGYVADFDDKEKDGTYAVRTNQAHAWAEAYIEGIGWIPFEATASFYNARYAEWKGSTDTDSVKPAPVIPYNYYATMGLTYKPEGVINKSKSQEKNDDSKNDLNEIIIIAGAIASILLSGFAYYFMLKYRYKKCFCTADYNKKMYMLFLRILKLLKREGFDLGQQETILMLSNRVKDQFRFEQITFYNVANIYMRYRYAGTDTTKEELERVSIYYKGLSDKERKEVNRLKIWWENFIFISKKSNR